MNEFPFAILSGYLLFPATCVDTSDFSLLFLLDKAAEWRFRLAAFVRLRFIAPSDSPISETEAADERRQGGTQGQEPGQQLADICTS